jgi:hypothetical protein
MSIIKIIIAVALLSVISFSQTNIADLLYPRSPDTLVYSDLLSYSPDELKDIKKSLEPPEVTTAGCEFKMSAFLDTVKPDYFKKIDLNGDGQPDIIYSVHYCSEEMITWIWIKQNNTYKFSKAYFGTIIRLFKSQNKDYSLLIRTGYCCAGIVGYYKLYIPFDTDIYRAIEKRDINICEFIQTQFPNEKITPKKFITLNDKAPLRISHEINNSLDSLRSEFEAQAVYGNIVAEYVRGSSGKIIAEYSSNPGEHWYFVLMDNTNLIGYNRFYKAYNTYKCGWINSKDIKIR